MSAYWFWYIFELLRSRRSAVFQEPSRAPIWIKSAPPSTCGRSRGGSTTVCSKYRSRHGWNAEASSRIMCCRTSQESRTTHGCEMGVKVRSTPKLGRSYLTLALSYSRACSSCLHSWAFAIPCRTFLPTPDLGASPFALAQPLGRSRSTAPSAAREGRASTERPITTLSYNP